jgi:hypothetical protein
LTWRTDRAFRHPKSAAFDVTQDFDPMYRAYVPLKYLSAFAKDLGTTPDSFEAGAMPGDGTLRSELLNGNCDLNVRRESPREIYISSDCRGEGRLRIGQLYSPLWTVVPIQGVPLDSTAGVSADGLMELTLSPGKEDMRLVFDMGAPGRWGAILSEASLLFGLIGFVFFPRRPVRALAEIPVNLK